MAGVTFKEATPVILVHILTETTENLKIMVPCSMCKPTYKNNHISIIGERAKRVSHSQVCSIEIRNIYMSLLPFDL